jgi:hypothetical protein
MVGAIALGIIALGIIALGIIALGIPLPSAKATILGGAVQRA